MQTKMIEFHLRESVQKLWDKTASRERKAKIAKELQEKVGGD